MNRAGAQAIRAGLGDDEKIANFGTRQAYFVPQYIQRGAEWAVDIDDFCGGCAGLVCKVNRVIFADDLAEIAGEGEVVVHPTVAD